MRDERSKAGLSTTALAERVRALATRGGLDMKLTQQSISKFEQGESKRLPLWFRYAVDALSRDDVSIDMLPDLPVADAMRDFLPVPIMPSYAGMGGGGNGDGDTEYGMVPRRLIHDELRGTPADFVLIEARSSVPTAHWSPR